MVTSSWVSSDDSADRLETVRGFVAAEQPSARSPNRVQARLVLVRFATASGMRALAAADPPPMGRNAVAGALCVSLRVKPSWSRARKLLSRGQSTVDKCEEASAKEVIVRARAARRCAAPLKPR